MLILIRLLTLISPLVCALPFWFIFTSLPTMFVFQIAAIVLVVATFLLFNKLSEKNDYRPLLTIIFFLLSIFSLSMLMERRLFAVALSILTLVIVWAWIEIHFKKIFKDGILEEKISYKTISFLIYASFFASIYGAREFIVTPVWILILILTIFSLFVFNDYLVVPNNIVDRWKQIVTVAVIQIQLFLIYLALPLPYYSKGALLILTFYSINNFFEIHKVQKKQVKNYIIEAIVFLSLLMLILLTTKW